MKTIEGQLNVRDARFCILAARFNDKIVEDLIRGSLDALRRHGVADSSIDIVRVPGAFELPLAARKVARARFEPLCQLIERSGAKIASRFP